jgi:hypothetical protein
MYEIPFGVPGEHWQMAIEELMALRAEVKILRAKLPTEPPGNARMCPKCGEDAHD